MTEGKQAEGFKLMHYVSKDGEEHEILWNSRDGITPFVISSRGGVEMSHVDWPHDVYAPFFVPPVGMRIFVDLTLEKAMEYRTEYVAKWWNRDTGVGTLADHVRGWDGADQVERPRPS